MKLKSILVTIAAALALSTAATPASADPAPEPYSTVVEPYQYCVNLARYNEADRWRFDRGNKTFYPLARHRAVPRWYYVQLWTKGNDYPILYILHCTRP